MQWIFIDGDFLVVFKENASVCCHGCWFVIFLDFFFHFNLPGGKVS